MKFNPTISLYNGVKDTKGTAILASEAINTIASDELSKQIIAITKEPDEKKQTALKIKLAAVTWSGSFKTRKASELKQYSGLICLDFDHLKDARKIKESLILQIPNFVYAIFISPRGNGLKVICRAAIKADSEYSVYEQFEKNFRALADFFKKIYNMEADESGKDICRLCFLSWDKSIWINQEPVEEFYYTDLQETQEPKPKPVKPEPKKVTSEKTKTTTSKKKLDPEKIWNNQFASQFEKLRAFTNKKFTYAEGKRNHYINAFVMNCKGHGIEAQEVLYYSKNEFIEYVGEHGEIDLANIIKSVYANAKIEFGKYAPKSKSQRSGQKKTTAGAGTSAQGKASEYNEDILFYYTVDKLDKNGDPVADKKTGEVKQETKFHHDRLTWFLHNNGFRKIKLGEKGYQFVRLSNGLIEAVEPEDISHFVMGFLNKNITTDIADTVTQDDIQDELHEVRNMYKRGINQYTKPAIYTTLRELKPTFLRDTEKTTYLYFENGYVEVNAEKKTLHPYSELKANIWSKQRKQFKISLLPNEEIQKSVIWQFLNCAIIGEGSTDGKDEQRMQSMITTIGYVLDTYKDPTNTKAPVFQDRKINSGTDANGGSGKTLTAHMIGKMINMCLIDGKDFSFDSPYPYDTFRVDHKLIVYNDVTRKFPFENLFHKITEDFQFDRRYVDAITVPQEDAPKHLVITNYSLSGSTSSFRRRQHIIEFSDYFDDEYTPKDEFKHRFFIDWNEEEWNRFYNCMIFCVQLYKEKGLVPFPAMNVKMNRLITEAGEEFPDWMDAVFIGDSDNPAIFDIKQRNSKDDLFEAFKKDVKRWSKMENTNKFKNWCGQWADMHNMYMDVSKSGKNYYWTFTDKQAKQS